MSIRRFLVGCLALASAAALPVALAQRGVPIRPEAPAPIPLPSPAPRFEPPPRLEPLTPASPAPLPRVAVPDSAGHAGSEDAGGEPGFETDPAEGAATRPKPAPAAVAPPESPTFSDICRATPRPPWCGEPSPSAGAASD